MKAFLIARETYVEVPCSAYLHRDKGPYPWMDDDERRQPVLLSLAGPAQACRAVARGLVAGLAVEVADDNGSALSLQKADNQSFKILSRSLGRNIHHVIVVDTRALPDERGEARHERYPFEGKVVLAIGDPGATEAGILVNALRRRYTTPFLPGWGNRLLEAMRETGRVKTLGGRYPGPAIEIAIEDDDLDNLVSREVREGRLTFQCPRATSPIS